MVLWPRTLGALLVVTVAACGGGPSPSTPSTSASSPTPAPPASPSPPPPPPVSPATSGRIDDAQAVLDIRAYNQDAPGGASFRRRGVITRWELPVAVFTDGVNREAVADALAYWRAQTGITSAIVEQNVEPRILVRAGNDGLESDLSGRSVIDGTYSDNRARSALVVIGTARAMCAVSDLQCRGLFRHEVGHALGFLGHPPVGGMCGLMSCGQEVMLPRERAMMLTLYSLPHGAQVLEDGTWRVVPF